MRFGWRIPYNYESRCFPMDDFGLCSQCGAPLRGGKFCSCCGSPVPAEKPAAAPRSGKPETIEELRAYAESHNWPIEQMRLFIGINTNEAKAFGIYKEGGLFTVYKNKADGTRAVRYCGADEKYAVNEIYVKMSGEIQKRKPVRADGSTPAGTEPMPDVPQASGMAGNRKIRRRVIIAAVILALCAIFYYIIKEPDYGYYYYDDTYYYYIDGDWYYYDYDYDDWYYTEVNDIPEDDYDRYWYGYSYDYDSSDGYYCSDFSGTEYYEEYSSDSSSHDDDDDYWDSGDSWDSGGTDWDSDW